MVSEYHNSPSVFLLHAYSAVLPAVEIDFDISFSQLSGLHDLDLNLGSSHSYGIPSCISHQPLPTYEI